MSMTNIGQLRIKYLLTYTTDYDYKRRERRVAFRRGEHRKVSVTAYVQPPENRTTTNIDFGILDYEGRIISQSLLENIIFERNSSSITLDMSIANYDEGVYRVKVSIGGSTASAVFIIGSPEIVRSVLSPKNYELCARIAKDICEFYEPCSQTVYPIINNDYSVLKNEQVIRKHLGIQLGMPFYIFADATLTNSGKKGIAVCQDGIHIHKGVFLNWYDFLMTDIRISGPLLVGGTSIYIFSAEDATFADLLGYIQREIIDSINLQS